MSNYLYITVVLLILMYHSVSLAKDLSIQDDSYMNSFSNLYISSSRQNNDIFNIEDIQQNDKTKYNIHFGLRHMHAIKSFNFLRIDLGCLYIVNSTDLLQLNLNYKYNTYLNIYWNLNNLLYIHNLNLYVGVGTYLNKIVDVILHNTENNVLTSYASAGIIYKITNSINIYIEYKFTLENFKILKQDFPKFISSVIGIELIL
ncbi:hypothetical protein [Candidatus Neoehrlichia procyonis]|nr:hypothetical protein [Candidatus Neoehrlichia lotoris]